MVYLPNVWYFNFFQFITSIVPFLLVFFQVSLIKFQWNWLLGGPCLLWKIAWKSALKNLTSSTLISQKILVEKSKSFPFYNMMELG